MRPLHTAPNTQPRLLAGRLSVREAAAALRSSSQPDTAEPASRQNRTSAQSQETTARSQPETATSSGRAATLESGAARGRLQTEFHSDDFPHHFLAQQSLVPSWVGGIAAASTRLSEYKLPLLSLPIQVNKPPAPIQQEHKPRPGKDPKKREDFYANVGEAIRVLRAEIPLLFQEDLTYDIYRDDITFRDPRNKFQGKKDYRTIFWSLRFHGQLFFRVLYVDVLRIWESPENVKDAGTVLKMRWSVHGVPRVPWDAEGIFDGISTFKLDSNGKIFEHMVNNVILKDPPKQGNPFLAGLNLIPLPQQQQPCPGAWFKAKSSKVQKKDGDGMNMDWL